MSVEKNAYVYAVESGTVLKRGAVDDNLARRRLAQNAEGCSENIGKRVFSALVNEGTGVLEEPAKVVGIVRQGVLDTLIQADNVIRNQNIETLVRMLVNNGLNNNAFPDKEGSAIEGAEVGDFNNLDTVELWISDRNRIPVWVHPDMRQSINTANRHMGVNYEEFEKSYALICQGYILDEKGDVIAVPIWRQQESNSDTAEILLQSFKQLV